MFYYLEDIKEDVRIVLDENQVSDHMMDDIDTLSVDEIIRSKVEEAAAEVYLASPVHLFEPGERFADTIAWKEKVGVGPGWTILPNDFLRLISFKMSDWERPVYSAILPDDPQYLLQSSRFAGIRGNCQKPVCAIVMRPTGRVLEFYSCSAGEGVCVEMARYAPKPTIKDEGIDIYERSYRSVVYKVAGLTAMSVGATEQAKALFEISNGLLK